MTEHIPNPVDFLYEHRLPRKRYVKLTNELFLERAYAFWKATSEADLHPNLGELFVYLDEACGFDSGEVRTVGWCLIDNGITLKRGAWMEIAEVINPADRK